MSMPSKVSEYKYKILFLHSGFVQKSSQCIQKIVFLLISVSQEKV